MLKRLFCLLSAFAVLFFISAPVFATGMEMGDSGNGAGVPVGLQVKLDIVDFCKYIDEGTHVAKNFFCHLLDNDVCPYAPQLGGGHNFVPRRTMVDGQIGLYYQCEYCGRSYGEALEEAYQDYVETLPGKSVNSDGAYLWIPEPEDFCGSNGASLILGTSSRYLIDSAVSVRADDYYSVYPSGYSVLDSYRNTSVIFLVGDEVAVNRGQASTSTRSVSWPYVRVPITGYYSVHDDSVDVASMRNGNSVLCAGLSCVKLGYARYLRAVSGSDLHIISSPTYSCAGTAGYYDAQTAYFAWPKFWVTPFESSGSGGNTYELATRVSGSASDGGMFGYVQDGTLYQSTVTNIYNESTGAYQNPVTGDTATVASWAYDYSDRSYTLTTNEGDEITVTYGDSNVTINEGGTTYNVYYLMEETEDIREELESVCVHDYSSSVTTPPTCAASGVKTYTCSECGHSYTQTVPPTGHDYQSAVTMAPTCVGTGVRTFTCSECGDSYTVSIAATGHTWEVISTVPTTYDSETGQLIQQGYTLYECATCHEQYRISADSGGSSLPAPSSGGTSTGGADLLEIDSDVGRGFLATIAQGLTHDLPEVLEAASGWFTTFPQFYSGFVTFVKDGVAGCLPDTPRQMMGFGFGMTTLIGIVRKIFGR